MEERREEREKGETDRRFDCGWLASASRRGKRP